MVRQDQSIKLLMVCNQKNVAPILVLENLPQPRFVVPSCRRAGRPFDGGTVSLETRVADIGFGAHFAEREIVRVQRLKSRSPLDAW